MDEKREQFLAGERPDDVLIYLDERAVDGIDRLASVGEAVTGGVVLILPGEDGRAAFQRATGHDPMGFAREAMETEGTVAPDCTGGTCPENGHDDHWPRFVFAFAEEQNEEVGGVYAEGDVVHAYALCDCGTAYSQTWLAGERE